MATVDKVLRWRRPPMPLWRSTTPDPQDDLGPLLAVFKASQPRADTALITRAYEVARAAHEGQVRRSGDPYIQHPLAVAKILAELGLDDVTLSAALLHDSVEDTGVTLEEVASEFGDDVAAIVGGVTKLDRVSFDSKEAQQAATMRKMLVAMAKDIRVLLSKLADRLHNIPNIFDLVGIRVLVDSVKDCYAALGSIHATWKPVQGRFKDYIAMPKFNLYQSLHTTVVGPQGKPLEVQIRTKEMHRRAEFGVAAHWGYKEHTPETDTAWLQRIVDWQQETSDPREFMESLKIDLEQDEVFVFTPKGDVVTLPAKATPIDFAYSIHPEVGHRCIGARINGRLTSLDSTLTSGDTVEVFTSKVTGAGPSRDWLKIVVTPRARNKIRQWFSRERREDAIENGRDELTKALRREGLPVQKVAASAVIPKVAEAMNYADLDALHAAIGEGHVSAKSVAQRIARELRGGDHEEQLPSTARQPRPSRRKQTVGVHVEGLDDVMVRLSRCCTPVPGDEIIGFVTRGRGVSVHRADCANAASLVATNGDRLIEVEGDRDGGGVFVASIEIEALDRSKLLRDITTVLSDHHVNVLASSSHTGSDRVAHLRFDFELGDPSHLESLLGTLKRVDSVFDAYRMLPGHGNGAKAG